MLSKILRTKNYKIKSIWFVENKTISFVKYIFVCNLYFRDKKFLTSITNATTQSYINANEVHSHFTLNRIALRPFGKNENRIERAERCYSCNKYKGNVCEKCVHTHGWCARTNKIQYDFAFVWMTLRVCARICKWCGWCLCFTAQFKQHTNSKITHYAHWPNAFPNRLRAFRNWMFAEPTSFLFYSYIFDDSAQFELYFWYLMKWQMWKIVWVSITNALVLFSSSHEHYFTLPKDTSIGYPRAGLLRKMKIGIHFFFIPIQQLITKF